MYEASWTVEITPPFRGRACPVLALPYLSTALDCIHTSLCDCGCLMMTISACLNRWERAWLKRATNAATQRRTRSGAEGPTPVQHSKVVTNERCVEVHVSQSVSLIWLKTPYTTECVQFFHASEPRTIVINSLIPAVFSSQRYQTKLKFVWNTRTCVCIFQTQTVYIRTSINYTWKHYRVCPQ